MRPINTKSNSFARCTPRLFLWCESRQNVQCKPRQFASTTSRGNVRDARSGNWAMQVATTMCGTSRDNLRDASCEVLRVNGAKASAPHPSLQMPPSYLLGSSRPRKPHQNGRASPLEASECANPTAEVRDV